MSGLEKINVHPNKINFIGLLVTLSSRIRKISRDSQHYEFKVMFHPMGIKEWIKVKSPISGEMLEVPIPYSTTELDMQGWSDFYTPCEAHAIQEYGVIF